MRNPPELKLHSCSAQGVVDWATPRIANGYIGQTAMLLWHAFGIDYKQCELVARGYARLVVIDNAVAIALIQ